MKEEITSRRRKALPPEESNQVGEVCFEGERG